MNIKILIQAYLAFARGAVGVFPNFHSLPTVVGRALVCAGSPWRFQGVGGVIGAGGAAMAPATPFLVVVSVEEAEIAVGGKGLAWRALHGPTVDLAKLET